jgi:hypothetical protein
MLPPTITGAGEGSIDPDRISELLLVTQYFDALEKMVSAHRCAGVSRFGGFGVGRGSACTVAALLCTHTNTSRMTANILFGF